MVRLVPGSRTAQGFERFELSEQLGMMRQWANSDGCRTRTALRGCARWQQCGGYLANCWRGKGPRRHSWRWHNTDKGRERYECLESTESFIFAYRSWRDWLAGCLGAR